MYKFASRQLKHVFLNPDSIFKPFYLHSYAMKRSMSGDTLLNMKKTPIAIGTHSGVFHCDEALACYLLKILYPQASIVRSRDPKVYEKCDVVVDVGGIYNPEKNLYDHHQQSFQCSMSTLTENIESTVKLSSAGLIYHHFGKSVLKKLMQQEEDETKLEYIYKKLYLSLIREVDGIDNGIPAHCSEPLYDICTDISARVSRLNKPWTCNDPNWDDDSQFRKAMDLVGEEFMEQLKIINDITYPARQIVWRSIQDRFNVHSSGEIIELPCACPWKNHFFDLEEIHDIQPRIKYVLFEGGDSYRIQCVPVTLNSFVGRKFLPKSWRGLRDEELSKISGIEGCIFVHSNGFIGGHSTREGTLQMGIKALENFES